MEFVPLLRTLWRRRILVVLGAMVSIALGVMATGGPTSRSGVASTRVVLDTERSQLIYRAPIGHETLPWRAQVLADLTASRPLRERIAAEVGIKEQELVVVLPELSAPVIASTLPSRASRVANTTFEEYKLIVGFDELAPIISIQASAPSRAAAARLAGAASTALQDTGTPASGMPGIQGLSAEGVGPVQSREIVDKPKLVVGIALVVCLFGAWCGALALGPRLVELGRAVAGRPRAA